MNGIIVENLSRLVGLFDLLCVPVGYDGPAAQGCVAVLRKGELRRTEESLLRTIIHAIPADSDERWSAVRFLCTNLWQMFEHSDGIKLPDQTQAVLTVAIMHLAAALAIELLESCTMLTVRHTWSPSLVKFFRQSGNASLEDRTPKEVVEYVGARLQILARLEDGTTPNEG